MSEWTTDIPKAVLHDHLDGGLRVSTLIDLAEEQNYENLPTNDPETQRFSIFLSVDIL